MRNRHDPGSQQTSLVVEFRRETQAPAWLTDVSQDTSWLIRWGHTRSLVLAFTFALDETRWAVRAAEKSKCARKLLAEGWRYSIIRLTYYPLPIDNRRHQIGAVISRTKVHPKSALEQLAKVAR